MKKIIIIAIFAILGILPVALTASATTVSFSPASIQAAKGQAVAVSIVVNPAGVSNFTEKLELKFPADLLQVTSFNLGGTWIGLTQPGYDLTDNVNGVLIKTGGYPAGFSTATTFGTVTFRALKAGSGTITVGGNSVAFQVSSQSVLTGTAVPVTITAPVIVAPTPVSAVTASGTKATTSMATTTASTSQSAAAGDLTGKNASVWIVILLVILIAESAAFWMYVRRQRSAL